MKLDFLCIGCQKAGTDSLVEYLNLSHHVCLSGEKHFFDVPKHIKLTQENYQYYESLVPNKKKIRGEKTPSYCYLPFAIDRIYEYNPDIKLIMILREPISRVGSQINMLFHRNKFPGCNFNNVINRFIDENKDITFDSLKSNGHYPILRGFYSQQIEYILSKFPRENVYIGIAEEIRCNKEIEYNKIFKFLGITDTVKIKHNLDTHVRNYRQIMSLSTEKKLLEIYKPHNQKLYELLGRKIQKWEDYYNSIEKNDLNNFGV